MRTAAVAAAAPGLYATMSDTMHEVLDAIVATEAMIASVSAYRARLIDQAREWSEVTAHATSTTRPGGWDAATVAHREFVTELACALRLPERTTETLISHSRSLAHELPATLVALQNGEISYRHAQSIIGHADTLPASSRHDFELAVVPAARELTVARFESKARVLRERMHPDSLAIRHRRCLNDRHVSITPDRDGMAWLNAYLPAAEAIAIDNRLIDIAAGLSRSGNTGTDNEGADNAGTGDTGTGDTGSSNTSPSNTGSSNTGPGDSRSTQTSTVETRTRVQLIADIFTDLLIDGSIAATDSGLADRSSGDRNSHARISSERNSNDRISNERNSNDRNSNDRTSLGRGIRATVLVTVPVLTMLGLDDEPANLEGYGPIDADTARRLCANAPSFMRLLTHPETGAVLSVGRDRYVVPKDLRRWLRVRDEHCRFPGCGRRAQQCEVDHTIDWQHHGSTRHDNLAHLCANHHHVKHHTGWTIKQLGGGELTWTSPRGRNYTTRPATAIRT